MKNFQITDKETGKVYWISRAMAVAGVIYAKDSSGNLHFLVEKRGPGCPDYVGYNALCCGYLDWDESLEEAMIREAWEEMGLKIDPTRDSIVPFFIQDNPKDNSRQNVTVRFMIEVPYDYVVEGLKNGSINGDTKSRGGEEGEIEEINLISLDDLKKHKWAWNHDEVIRFVSDILNDKRSEKVWKLKKKRGN